MKITQFKKMLAQHGADFSRWEGVSENEVTEFLKSSEKAQALLAEEKKLDDAIDAYYVGKFDEDKIISSVMAEIGAEADPVQSGSVHKLDTQKKKKEPFVRASVFWSGVTAIAATIILFVFVMPESQIQQRTEQSTQLAQETATQPAVVASADYTQELDTIIVEEAEEEIAAHEVISLWRFAELQTVSSPDSGDVSDDAANGIDSFLDETLPLQQDSEPVSQEEMDLWELFLASEAETAEL